MTKKHFSLAEKLTQDEGFVELWSEFPFREGAISKLYAPGCGPKYGRLHSSEVPTAKQIRDIEKIIECRLDLDSLRAFLVQCCNEHHVNRLKWPDILRHVQRYNHMSKKSDKHVGNVTDDVFINIVGDSRYIEISGLEPFHITAENQWNFIKDLVSAHKSDEYVPECKNAVDGIRRSLQKQYGKPTGNKILSRILTSVKGCGYKLGTVEYAGFGSLCIRRTKQRAEL